MIPIDSLLSIVHRYCINSENVDRAIDSKVFMDENSNDSINTIDTILGM